MIGRIAVKSHFLKATSLLTALGASLALAASAAAPARAQGPCDILAAAGTPCVAAHSTTRALLTSYRGPLYQVQRPSDGRKLDIGIMQPAGDAGGYADAAAQDAFCANTLCVINVIYDQSGNGNHLWQAPPGLFKGPAKGGFNTRPIADMAPVTLDGHKVYGVYIMPGMGFRNNDATGLAIGDEPEGIYYVIDGTHYDSGCCFDYGNASTNGLAVGTGTMETTYFGTATAWGSGSGPGPWLMADMEGGLFSGYHAKQNVADPTIDSWRFVTAVVNGGGGNRWELRGGNAQQGGLTTFYRGVRPGSLTDSSYYPMRKQGGILLGTGGDNGNGSAGTFYEGVMTAGYPTEAATDAVQANIVAARYGVAFLALSRVSAFTPGSAQNVTAAFTNSTQSPIAGVTLSLALPAGWTARAAGSGNASVTIAAPVAPGESVSAAFQVTSPTKTEAGFLTGTARWTGVEGRARSESVTARLRNAPAVRINEVRFGTGSNPTDQFVELYNASAGAVDISNWTLVHTASQWAPVELARIPAGTSLASGGFYLLGLAPSGLASPAHAGERTVNVRSTTGFSPGQQVEIDGETRTVASVGTPSAAMTTLFVPVSTGPWLTIPRGSTNLPVTSAAGFAVGEQIGIDLGGNFELATVTAVGKAGTQTTLAAAALAGGSNIRLAATGDISAGDTLIVGTGGRKESVAVRSVGSAGANGTGIELNAPLRLAHAAGVDVSDRGTGITFAPATKFPHVSGDALQALGSGLALDRPLDRDHPYGAPVVTAQARAAGYQGPPSPAQWFGGTLSPRAGSIALRAANGDVVVDAIVYGSQQSSSSGNGTIASPELATLESDQGQGGCIAVVPAAGGFGPAAAATPGNRSLGRYPDGHDSDRLCRDFRLQSATSLATAAPAGTNNLKVTSVPDFAAGQPIVIDAGANVETATIATVGTAGGTTIGSATAAGASVIPVASAAGFAAGQAISIDTEANAETAVVASVTGGRRGASITLTVPLARAHAAGAQVSGSGITLAAPLTRAHDAAAQVAGSVPTPGAPNRYQ